MSEHYINPELEKLLELDLSNLKIEVELTQVSNEYFGLISDLLNVVLKLRGKITFTEGGGRTATWWSTEQ